ncbi:sulfotransferase 6B1-like isoform X2 [Alosa sapidissima]|uniref:sulfotransferase 6B1-like isoform X2 n=1 Tax=Alosa sapidissima TaxID=34773 RepID=UPI001C09DED5|nr:sulfotransferase 6B1-like isoform X2 [Alosa sapidissima]
MATFGTIGEFVEGDEDWTEYEESLTLELRLDMELRLGCVDYSLNLEQCFFSSTLSLFVPLRPSIMTQVPAPHLAILERSKNVKDEDKMYRFEGRLYPSIVSPAENLEALRTMEARADDVMLVAYPKCGFNWMVAVLRKIIAASSGVKESSEMAPLIEFCTPERQKAIAEQPSPRLLGTHLYPEIIPASFKDMKTKMLVVWRNPKDTLVSYFHFMNKNPVLPSVEWDQFFSDFMSGEVGWGSYFDHALAWNKLMDDPNVKTVTFEELKQDLSEGIRQISQFFGFPLTEEQVQTIYSETTFSAMSTNSVHGKMGSVFFRKGEVGDWRNHFSEAQSQQMDEEFNKRLAGTKLGALLQYDTYCK